MNTYHLLSTTTPTVLSDTRPILVSWWKSGIHRCILADDRYMGGYSYDLAVPNGCIIVNMLESNIIYAKLCGIYAAIVEQRHMSSLLYKTLGQIADGVFKYES